MTRLMDTPVSTGVVAKVTRFCFFAEFEFASGTLRMWSGTGDKGWNSQTWTGLGDLVGFGPIDETTEIGASGMSFTMSAVKNSIRALALADKYRGRKCRLWIAILDADLSTVVGTYQVFAGRMNTMALTAADAEMSRLSLSAESRLVDLRRPRPSRHTAAEQKRIDPTDTSHDRTAKLAERPLPWGVPPTAPAAAPGGGWMGNVARRLP
jgi:hypothetical protein